MDAWSKYVERATRQHGDKLDLSEINQAFVPYFRGPRVKVRAHGKEITGTVSVTTGWKPALMRRSNASGSSDLLTADAELVGVQHGRQYVTV